MKNTTAFKRYLAAAAVSVVAMLTTSMAQADTVICADPIISGQKHQFRTTGASDCVWANDGNIGQGQPSNDAFLLKEGTNDELWGTVATSGPTFGLTWTTIDSQNATEDDNQIFTGIPDLIGLTIGGGATDKSFTWTLKTADIANLGFNTYALGLKDGSDPSWAVFLLSALTGQADIFIDKGDDKAKGSWSHVVLYGTYVEPGSPPPNEVQIPEPGTLALVGLALLGGVAIRRRKV